MKVFRSRLFAACIASLVTAFLVGGIASAQQRSSNVGASAVTRPAAAPSAVRLSGVVRVAAGNPTGKLTVYAQLGRGTSESVNVPVRADGSYSISVPPGSYFFSVLWQPYPNSTNPQLSNLSYSEYSTQNLAVQNNLVENVTMPGLAALNATVSTATSQPAANVPFSINPCTLTTKFSSGAPAAISGPNIFTTTDAQGHYSTSVPRGSVCGIGASTTGTGIIKKLKITTSPSSVTLKLP